MPQPTTINDCMRRNPLTINVSANLVQAIEIIVEYKLTGLTVTDDEGRPVGILSELDCLQAILTAIYNDGDPEHAMVRDAMCDDLNVCQATDSLVEVAQSMLSTRQRRRPVGSKPQGSPQWLLPLRSCHRPERRTANSCRIL